MLADQFQSEIISKRNKYFLSFILGGEEVRQKIKVTRIGHNFIEYQHVDNKTKKACKQTERTAIKETIST